MVCSFIFFLVTSYINIKGDVFKDQSINQSNKFIAVCTVKNVTEIADLYTISCHKHNTRPLEIVLEHLKAVDLQKQLRQPALTLASIKLSSSDCEALEEIFKRVSVKLRTALILGLGRNFNIYKTLELVRI